MRVALADQGRAEVEKGLAKRQFRLGGNLKVRPCESGMSGRSVCTC